MDYKRCYRHDVAEELVAGPKLLARAEYALGHVGLLPLPTPEGYIGTVVELHQRLLHAHKTFLGPAGVYPPFCPGCCSPTRPMISEIGKLLRQGYHASPLHRKHDAEFKEAFLPLTKAEKARLRRQREKSGIVADRRWL